MPGAIGEEELGVGILLPLQLEEDGRAVQPQVRAFDPARVPGRDLRRVALQHHAHHVGGEQVHGIPPALRGDQLLEQRQVFRAQLLGLVHEQVHGRVVPFPLGLREGGTGDRRQLRHGRLAAPRQVLLQQGAPQRGLEPEEGRDILHVGLHRNRVLRAPAGFENLPQRLQPGVQGPAHTRTMRPSRSSIRASTSAWASTRVSSCRKPSCRMCAIWVSRPS